MKAALLSFHSAYNYGAALQAYGLQCAVQALGVDCEYLNYQNASRKQAYDMKYQFADAVSHRNVMRAAKMLVGMPVMAARARKFDQFYAACLRVTKEEFANSDEAKRINRQYDKFIVGSDQVWNDSHNGGDTAYLLDFVDDDAKKISYSSSFGVSSLTPETSAVYGELLGRFNRLSSRESIGTEIIERIAGRRAHVVLDPVFLAGKQTWEELRDKKTALGKKYIFFYTNRQSQIRDFLNTGYVTDEAFHVLSTHITPKELLDSRVKLRISMSPEEFLSEIYNAGLVVTASFHCLALSIIFHKQFIVILTGDHGKDERINNLLKMTGLESRILTSETDRAAVLEKIDYAEVDRRLEPYLNRSREYLRRALFDEPDIPFDDSIQNKLFCQDARCTGCGACGAACPRGAITMESDAEGFRVPVLDKAKCVQCHQCHAVCPVYSGREAVADQRYYAVKNRDEIRRVSSSGGVFRALAESVFSDRGVVCAAGMDRDFRVRHMFAANMEELRPMCGTYYVQSDLWDAFRKIKAYLESGTKVLFVGTACQVHGLKNYLGGKAENLLACDILCHGAPSPMVFDRFIQFLRTKGEVTDFKFRDKRLGWKGYHVSAVINGKMVKDKLWLQSFNNLFSHNKINRLSCGSCRYTNYDRPGDMTIGDFWGIEKCRPDFLDPLGVSLVLINNKKGEDIFQRLRLPSVIRVEKNDTAQNSLQKPSQISSKRLQVFQSLKNCGYRKTMRVFGEASYLGYCKNLVRKAKSRIK